MAAKVSVRRGLRDGFAFAASRETWTHFLRMAWPLAALLVIGYAAFGWVGYAILLKLLTPPAATPGTGALAALVGSYLLFIVGNSGIAWMMAAAMRLRAMQFDHTLLPQGWGRAGLCIVWWSFLVSVPILIVGLIIGAPVAFGLMLAFPPKDLAAGASPSVIFGNLIFVGAVWIAAAVFIRWFLVAVARAAGGKLSAGEAWEIGRGHGLGLRLAFMAAVSSYAAPLTAALIAGFLLGPMPLFASPDQVRTLDPVTLPSPAVYGFGTLLLGFMLVFSLLWVSAVWVDAYRALTGAGDEAASETPPEPKPDSVVT